MKKILDWFFTKFQTKSMTDFKCPMGLFTMTLPKGWRYKWISKHEYLFIDISTNRALILNPFLAKEKTKEDLLKLHLEAALEENPTPKEIEIGEHKAIEWAYNFEESKTLEIKRIVYNPKVTIETSYCIKSSLNELEIHNALEKEYQILASIKFME